MNTFFILILYCCHTLLKLIAYFLYLFIVWTKQQKQHSLRTITMSSNHVSFSDAKQHLQEFFDKFVPTKRKYCINPECVKDTEGAVLYIWEANSLSYEHTDRQAALNISIIWVNGKKQWIRSHYCCECFKKHVLVGDNKHASQHYEYYCPGVQAVEVYFHYEPVHSTWYNSITKRDEKLSERQLCMLSD